MRKFYTHKCEIHLRKKKVEQDIISDLTTTTTAAAPLLLLLLLQLLLLLLLRALVDARAGNKRKQSIPFISIHSPIYNCSGGGGSCSSYLDEGGPVFAQRDPKALVHPGVPVQELVFVPKHDRGPHNRGVRQKGLDGFFARESVAVSKNKWVGGW